MVVIKVAVAALLVFGFLAGCTGPAPVEEKSPDLPAVGALGGRESQPIQASADAQAPGSNGEAQPVSEVRFEVIPRLSMEDRASWYMAAMDVPEGATGLGGFRWTIPEGAVLEDERGHWEGTSLEMALVIPEGETLEAFSISWFSLEGSTPELLSIQVGAPISGHVKTTPILEQPFEQAVQGDPWFVYLDEYLADDGDELGIVVSAQGPTAVGLAWRVMDEHLFDHRARPSSDAEVFIEDAMKMGPGLLLEPVAVGEGFQAAMYVDLNLYGALGFEMWSGPVQVEDSLSTETLRPATTLRETSISSSFPGHESGWGAMAAIYLTETGAATWRVHGDLHGSPIDEEGVAVGAYVAQPAFVTAFGSESAASDVSFDLTVASADVIEMLGFLTIDYGLAISTLLATNAPASGIETLYYGAPQVVDGDLVFGESMGKGIRFLGAVPA